MQDRPKIPVYTLTLDDLKASENPVIQKLASEDFFIIPPSDPNSLAKDVSRKSVELSFPGDQKLDDNDYEKLTGSPQEQSKKLAELVKTFYQACFLMSRDQRAYTDNEDIELVAEKIEKRYQKLQNAYCQEPNNLGIQALNAVLAEASAEDSNLRVQPSEEEKEAHKAVLDIKLKTLFSIGRSFSISTFDNDTHQKITLLDLKSGIKVCSVLKPISSDGYKKIIEGRKKLVIDKIASLVNDDIDSKAKGISINHLNNELKVLEGYLENPPKALFQIDEIRATPFMRDVLMSASLPHPKNYPGEVFINRPESTLEDTDDDLVSIKTTWRKYQKEIAGKIEKLVKGSDLGNRYLPGDYSGLIWDSITGTRALGKFSRKSFDVDQLVSDAIGRRDTPAKREYKANDELAWLIDKYRAAKELVQIFSGPLARVRSADVIFKVFKEKFAEKSAMLSAPRSSVTIWKTPGGEIAVRQTEALLQKIDAKLMSAKGPDRR